VSIIAVLSPRRIVLGGGVLQQQSLVPRIRRRVVELLAGYIRAREVVSDVEAYIVPPALGADAGVVGALALAHTTRAPHRPAAAE
jgi:fructokinase